MVIPRSLNTQIRKTGSSDQPSDGNIPKGKLRGEMNEIATMLFFVIFFILSSRFVANSSETRSLQLDTKCSGRPHYNVSLTAYYPDFNTGIESDYLDVRGKKLRTLQNFLDGRCSYVTVSVDEKLNLIYGSVLCVPELNEHFGRNIPLQVRDHGANLLGHGFSRLDICVRSEEDSYDKAVNSIVTVYT